MRYRIFKCTDKFVTDNAARIVEIAGLAFSTIPEKEIRDRLLKYDEILLILSHKNRVEGFNFCSVHRNGKSILVGGRLVAIDPVHKGQGYLRTASIVIFIRCYFLLLKNFALFRSNKLYIFSRQCNPIAYCLLHAGQKIYPDLVNLKIKEQVFPTEILNQYEFLKSEISVPSLNPKSGVVENGALMAGISPEKKSFNRKWATPWESYVGEGSELLSLIPVTPIFPIIYAKVLLRRLAKILKIGNIGTLIGGFFSTIIVVFGLFITSILGLVLLGFRLKRPAQVLLQWWAKLTLKIYRIKLSVSGNLSNLHGVVFAARHNSLLDTYIYPALLPANTAYVAKIELQKYPLFSHFFTAIGGLFVDRNRPISAAKSLRKLSSGLQKEDNLFIHPEGTRCSERQVGKLFSGVAYLAKQRNIVPISTFGGELLFPKGCFFPRPGEIKVVVGDPLQLGDLSSKLILEKINQIYVEQIQRN